MGTGKSTIGIQLAGSLDRSFKDLDSEIEEMAGMAIPDIFKKDGEEAFRKMEWKKLYELSQHYKGVLSLGGGTLQNQRVVDHLKLYGLLIFIETPMDEIIHRISEDKNRPMLLNEDSTEKDTTTLIKDMTALYKKRLPLYSQAQMSVRTSEFSSVEEIVNSLKDRIARYV